MAENEDENNHEGNSRQSKHSFKETFSIDQFVNLTSTPFFAAFPPQTFLCSVLASANIHQEQDRKPLDATRGLDHHTKLKRQ